MTIYARVLRWRALTRPGPRMLAPWELWMLRRDLQAGANR